LNEQTQNAAQQLIKQARFSDAEQVVTETLKDIALSDEHVELLYLLAVAQRYQNNHTDSLQTLALLLSLNKEHARAWQERGHNHLATNEPNNARIAFQGAVHFNPALTASWQALINLYKTEDNQQGLEHAINEVNYLKSLPPPLVAVNSFINEGKFFKADQLCRHFLRDNKQHIEGMRLLAKVGEQLDVLADAEFLLETALAIAPDNNRVRYDLANLLLKMQKFETALMHTAELVKTSPENLVFLSLHGNATAGVGDHAGAISIYNEVIDSAPNQHKLHVMRGHAEKTIGHLANSIRSYRKAFEIQPDYGDAFWSLANTKTYQFTKDEIEHMVQFEQSETISTEDQTHLCFALGKALEDRGNFDQSFSYYERGNDLMREEVRHRATNLNIRTQAQMDVCTADLFKQKSKVGFDAPDPIFVLGLPRAGSTLIEQILASHSQIDGTMELPNLIWLAQRLRGSSHLEEESGSPRYPQILTELDDTYFHRFGEQFIEQTRIYRESAPFFVDKNPNNFFHIGLIKLILPNAKVIDARRHPMSCCFSGFKQLFGQGQEFSYGLTEIGNYYREYVELMDHWDHVLPGFVHRVQHEDVVDNLEQEVRRLLEFCNLPFENECVEFYKTHRSVRTPSSEQVRQPIFRTALDAWQNYEPWLGPLKEALGPEVRARYNIQ